MRSRRPVFLIMPWICTVTVFWISFMGLSFFSLQLFFISFHLCCCRTRWRVCVLFAVFVCLAKLITINLPEAIFACVSVVWAALMPVHAAKYSTQDVTSFRVFWRPIVPIHSKQCSRKANLNWHNAVLIGICIQLRLERYTGQGRQTAKQNQANGSIYFVLLLPQEHSLYI